MKILVPAGVPFDAVPLLDDPADVVVEYDPSQLIPDEHVDAEVLVVWTIADATLNDATRRLAQLRWVQAFLAGPDRLLAAGFAPAVTICSGAGLHDARVAEHTLALMLAIVRDLDRTLTDQRDHVWDTQLMADQTAPANEPRYTLDGARVTIWGFGSIAARLTPLLQALGAEVTGLATSAGVRHGFPVLASSELERLLPSTDWLVSLLPASPANHHILSARLLALLPPHARFVNVGRGATVDEQALAAALRAGQLAGAALDVTETEPLPADSPLWDTPNLIITPHVAGGRPQNVKGFLTDQLRAWHAGGPAALKNVVNR